MSKIKRKIAILGVSVALLSSTIAFAASTYNYYCGTGVVTYASLNKAGSSSAIGETDFVPLNGYLSYRSYVYVQAENNSGIILSKGQSYGQGYGISNKPDIAKYTHTQSGTYRWMSTHRSEKTSNYTPLVIYN